jgi:hypothetical protein
MSDVNATVAQISDNKTISDKYRDVATILNPRTTDSGSIPTMAEVAAKADLPVAGWQKPPTV